MNLLTDPVIPATTRDGPQHMDLPTLLAGLGNDHVQRIDGLQRHQADAFHVFLCYLAGAILARDGDWNPVRDTAFWLDGMRMLSGEAGDDAWSLLTEDPSKPAFMQPPLPKSDHSSLKRQFETPDALDLLPTAKNHDLKQARAGRPESHEWLYALISLQTMSGYFGKGNPGISRMNGGFGNRPIVEINQHRLPAPRWRSAVQRLQDHRNFVLRREWGYRNDGLVLVWLREWNGNTALSLSELDPFYLEICRRVRLCGNDQQIEAASALPSNGNRIEAKELKGVVGDAWLPVDMAKEKGIKALTISPRGLTADLLRRLLFGDGIERTVLQQAPADEPEPAWLFASVLVRGQGTTDGFHQREIPIPPQVKKRLFGPRPETDPLPEMARTAIELAGNMQNRVLKPAVFTLMEGAPDAIQFDRDSASAWWRRLAERFDAGWSDVYFPWLWRAADLPEAEARLDWMRNLRDLANATLKEAETGLPQHRGRLWRARVAAEQMFYGALNKHFPDLKEPSHERTA